MPWPVGGGLFARPVGGGGGGRLSLRMSLLSEALAGGAGGGGGRTRLEGETTFKRNSVLLRQWISTNMALSEKGS